MSLAKAEDHMKPRRERVKNVWTNEQKQAMDAFHQSCKCALPMVRFYCSSDNWALLQTQRAEQTSMVDESEV